MTNAILEALKAALGVIAGFLPEKWAGLIRLVQSLLGTINVPPGDPRTEKVAKLVADLLQDVESAMQLDASAQETARLAIENRFLRAWVELSPGGGV